MAKSILITGCSTGIGLCAAQSLQQRGYQVIATVRKPQDKVKLEEQGLTCVLLDLNDSTSIQQAFAEVLSLTQGKLAALINNAGFGVMGAVEDLSRQSLRAQFETNVFGLQELTNLVIPVMRQQRQGRIINVSSVLGLVTLPYRGAYCASKYALESLSDALRMELRGIGIHVILIEPGPIVSQFRQSAEEVIKEHIDMTGSRHRATYGNLLQRQAQQKDSSRFTLGPEAVVAKMLHALESPRPKMRYFVTVPTYLIASLRRLLPARCLAWLLARFL